jgi:hypothetical protein
MSFSRARRWLVRFLGQAAVEAGAALVQDPRNWTVADYLKDPAIGDYFRPDHEGRFG